MAKRHDNNDIDRVAASWAARLDRGRLSAPERLELDAWLGTDRRHVGALARAQAVLTYFERAGALGGQYDPRDFADRRHVATVDRRRRHFLWMAGTGVAAGLAGAVVWWPTGRRVSTRLGEILRVPLSDGSAITLNSASTVSIHYERRRRLIRLLRGEALFDVAKDAARPFVVEAANASVIAVGTSFTVAQVEDASVNVMVREGVVEFRAPHVDTRRLVADMLATLRFDERISVEPLPAAEVRRRLAWREGMISFDGDTLAEAAAQFARYSDVRIVIDDPDVAARRIVGLYSSTDPVGFAKAVAVSMDLRVERRAHAVRLAAGAPD